MLTALLPATGQSQGTLVAIGIVGGILVVAGIAAMIGVRVSKSKNAASKTFTADAESAEKPAKKLAKPADDSK